MSRVLLFLAGFGAFCVVTTAATHDFWYYLNGLIVIAALTFLAFSPEPSR